MAAEELAGVGEPGRAVADLPLGRRLSFWGFATLVVLGAVFFLWWGMTFGVWIDNGVYAIVITLVGFGLVGMWLVSPNPPQPELPPPA